jgi:signal transduction histidine kinase
MSIAEELRSAFLTQSLTDEQLEELIAAGEVREFEAGEALFDEGRAADLLWILLAGEVELSRRIGNHPTVVASMTTPGQWAGGLSAWGTDDGYGVYRASGRAVVDGHCFLVPADALSEMVGRWSPFAKHMITGVYQTVRGIDAMARERESLVALGALAARLAHEINNPASAALRTVDALQRTGTYMLEALVGLAELGIHADDFLALDRLRTELQGRPPALVGAIATADREEAVGLWMEDHDVDAAWQIAPILAAGGVDREWLDELERRVGDEPVEASLRWISSTIGMAALLEELREATSRITHLVADVKTYSQVDRAEVQRTDVAAGISSTITMFGPKTAGVDIRCEFDPAVPEIEAYAAELNQVWTNVIDNALDALDGTGTLLIVTRLDGDHVVVEVTDSGPGMDPTVLAHVFEPFFTTKDVGKGTGLGLDISRRIVVDRHGGDISFESAPGATTATIRLPVSA